PPAPRLAGTPSSAADLAAFPGVNPSRSNAALTGSPGRATTAAAAIIRGGPRPRARCRWPTPRSGPRPRLGLALTLEATVAAAASAGGGGGGGGPIAPANVDGLRGDERRPLVLALLVSCGRA
ncbi:unnamed protein product, partial [Ectocarpus sp. 12 AP-2014]